MSYCGADKEPDWRNTSVIMTLDTPLFKKWSNGIPFKQQKLVISKTSRDILLFSACSDTVYFLSGGFSEKVLLFLWARFSSSQIRTRYSWLGSTNPNTVHYIPSPQMPWLGCIKWWNDECQTHFYLLQWLDITCSFRWILLLQKKWSHSQLTCRWINVFIGVHGCLLIAAFDQL